MHDVHGMISAHESSVRTITFSNEIRSQTQISRLVYKLSIISFQSCVFEGLETGFAQAGVCAGSTGFWATKKVHEYAVRIIDRSSAM
jgi:hypothetical protein